MVKISVSALTKVIDFAQDNLTVSNHLRNRYNDSDTTPTGIECRFIEQNPNTTIYRILFVHYVSRAELEKSDDIAVFVEVDKSDHSKMRIIKVDLY